MKTILKTLLLLAFSASAAFAQTQEGTPLPSFKKIVASPRVNVILQKGDRESIRFEYNDIPKNRVNAFVKGNTLKIFLDHARVTERQMHYNINGDHSSHGIYAGSSVTAYVTYTELKSLQIRGEGELRCDSEIRADKFKLKAYGESEIRLAEVNATKFKACLYGENDVKIKSGTTERQVYRLFGENKIDTRGMKSEVASTRIYGEGKVSVTASDEVHISAFGEPTINVEGTSIISKRIVLGRAHINTNQ